MKAGSRHGAITSKLLFKLVNVSRCRDPKHLRVERMESQLKANLVVSFFSKCQDLFVVMKERRRKVYEERELSAGIVGPTFSGAAMRH